MPRYTAAYSSFVSRLDEVEVLRSAALRKERSGAVKYRNEINAVCRGAVVLLCSHVEAFTKELGEIALEAFVSKRIGREKFPHKLFYHISKDIIDEIYDTNDPDKIAEKLFHFLRTDIVYWSQVGEFPAAIPVDRFNKGFANPAFEKIRVYLSRFGYNCYRNDINRLLRAKSAPAINMLNHLVDTRNNIAHGNTAATKTPGELRDIIDLVTIYCRATDDVFATGAAPHTVQSGISATHR